MRLNKSEPSTASVYENITDDCKPNVGQTCNPSNFFRLLASPSCSLQTNSYKEDCNLRHLHK